MTEPTTHEAPPQGERFGDRTGQADELRVTEAEREAALRMPFVDAKTLPPAVIIAAVDKVARVRVTGRDPRRSARALALTLDRDGLLWCATEYLHGAGCDMARISERRTEEAARRAAEEERQKADAERSRAFAESQPHGRGWHQAHGCRCDVCEAARREESDRWYAEDKARAQRLRESVDRALATYKAELRAEWTAELLASTFAVGDGRIVTWGSATADDHRARITMLTKMAAGTIETAAMHQKALDELAETGADCLAEVRAAA